jgi:hypothetical protein
MREFYFDSLLFFYTLLFLLFTPLSTPQHGLRTHAVDECCEQRCTGGQWPARGLSVDNSLM